MHARKWIASSLLLSSAIAGCDSAPLSRPVKVPPGAVYTAPLGNFTALVPPLLEPDVRQFETVDPRGASDGVTFSDDFGTLLDVQSQRLPVDDLLPPFASQVLPEQLDAYVDRRVLPTLLGATGAVVHRQGVSTPAGDAVFLVVNLPGGSARSLHGDAGQPCHPDAVRGVLVFPQLRWVYTVSVQQWPPTPNAPHLSAGDRDSRLLSDLRQTIARMTFD